MDKNDIILVGFLGFAFFRSGCWGFLGDCWGHIWRMLGEMLNAFSYSVGGFGGGLLEDF